MNFEILNINYGQFYEVEFIGNDSEKENPIEMAFTEYFTHIDTPGVDLKTALEWVKDGRRLMDQVLDPEHENPEPTIENLRKISWFLLGKSAEQGEFLHRGSIRFEDSDNKFFNWLKDGFDGKGLYRRISTHYELQSATKEKKNFMGFKKGLFLQPNQYGIEDYELQLPGGKGAVLFDKLKDGSVFVKFENVGVPTRDSALSAHQHFPMRKEELSERVKVHKWAHVFNFLGGLIKPLGKLFSNKKSEAGKLVKKTLSDQNIAGKQKWVHLENVPSNITENFKKAVKSLVRDSKARKRYFDMGKNGYTSEDIVTLGGITAMQKVIKILIQEKSSTPEVKKFYKEVDLVSHKKNHELDRVGTEVIIKI